MSCCGHDLAIGDFSSGNADFLLVHLPAEFVCTRVRERVLVSSDRVSGMRSDPLQLHARTVQADRISDLQLELLTQALLFFKQLFTHEFLFVCETLSEIQYRWNCIMVK